MTGSKGEAELPVLFTTDAACPGGAMPVQKV
jgi:hypothetical protein